MLTIDIIDPAEFTRPLAGKSVHFLGGAPGESRDLAFNLFITSDAEKTIGLPTVAWSWKQGTVVSLKDAAVRTKELRLPTGLSVIPYTLFSRVDTQALADGAYQVTATLLDGVLPLASVTHTLRIDRTDLYLVSPEEIADAAEKRFYNLERGLLEWSRRIETLEKRLNAD